MTSLSTVIIPDVLRSINSTTFTGSYQAVGAALGFATRIVKFTNNSTVGVTISWDGINAHEFLPANSFLLLDVTTNHENALTFLIQKGTQFYVSASAGTGLFYISCYYGK
jgi:hypothetical protein